MTQPVEVAMRIGARVGLLGNPSDGFYGKTIACLIANFSTDVWLRQSPDLCIVPPSPQGPLVFANLDDLHRQLVDPHHYTESLPLVLTSCKVFADTCRRRGIDLSRRNFTLTYGGNIPPQVGLAGSSALVVGTLQALMQFYGIDHQQIAQVELPSIALSVEVEGLGLVAGLQDRVAQVYGGLVYMDFDKDHMTTHGYGRYEPLDISLLPPLYLAYDHQGKKSGWVHRPIRQRWLAQDPQVVEAMATLACIAKRGREALLAQNHGEFGRLMDRNFDTRLALYGEDLIGQRSMRMVCIAREMGLCAKLAGSGGAVVGICPPEKWDQAAARFHKEGFGCCTLEPTQTLAPG